ncbi:hypothetical protein MVEG_11090 [Podila verticillata NRRL 6337]|uniref:Uncharacterized protein n=1 Tax=Podila verticillata NRRL 6337 TaxID=1069443 RepID=A0A086TM76_9FUNG|nr:hypothetical protein MVEG_11090 [Podila verticillata NRRL 6337]
MSPSSTLNAGGLSHWHATVSTKSRLFQYCGRCFVYFFDESKRFRVKILTLPKSSSLRFGNVVKSKTVSCA